MEVELQTIHISAKAELLKFIEENTFPCLMAKAVAKTGLLKVHSVSELESDIVVEESLTQLYQFVEEFRSNPKRLGSFSLVLKGSKQISFSHYERIFWSFLSRLQSLDKKKYPHDPRVSSDPAADNFSFSLKSEAFFILALHPESPRWARRFKHPTIVFNPHIQFENLRSKGTFKKIQSLIRLKDKLLQGAINPMLNDFGEKSEVFQYIGRMYKSYEANPLSI